MVVVEDMEGRGITWPGLSFNLIAVSGVIVTSGVWGPDADAPALHSTTLTLIPHQLDAQQQNIDYLDDIVAVSRSYSVSSIRGPHVRKELFERNLLSISDTGMFLEWNRKCSISRRHDRGVCDRGFGISGGRHNSLVVSSSRPRNIADDHHWGCSVIVTRSDTEPATD